MTTTRAESLTFVVHGRLECAVPAGCPVGLVPIAATTVRCVEGRARLSIDDERGDHVLAGGGALRLVGGRSLILPTQPAGLRFDSEPPGQCWRLEMSAGEVRVRAMVRD